jgi:hypothetical protein
MLAQHVEYYNILDSLRLGGIPFLPIFLYQSTVYPLASAAGSVCESHRFLFAPLRWLFVFVSLAISVNSERLSDDGWILHCPRLPGICRRLGINACTGVMTDTLIPAYILGRKLLTLADTEGPCRYTRS